MEKSEEEEDIELTLSKIPQSHRNLLRGFNIKFHKGNTLNGDDEHVGYMDDKEKEIAVAAPWRYPREWTFLHEIAHLVWQNFVTQELRDKWAIIVKNTKHKQNQNAEELFAMSYSNYYAHHKIEIHNHAPWDDFIKNLPK
jgi:hypothetical protein